MDSQVQCSYPNWLYNGMITLIPAMYLQISNIRTPLVGNKITDHSDVVGASPVGALITRNTRTIFLK